MTTITAKRFAFSIASSTSSGELAMSLTILLLIASALLIVFAFGLTASVHDALYLLRRPGALVRAILAMGVLMPMFAIAVVSILILIQR